MKVRSASLGTSLALASMLGIAAPVQNVQASEKGRKNTAIGLGAAAVHQLLEGKTGNAVVLGAGAAYAYKRYEDKKKENRRSERVTRSTVTTTTRERYGASSATSNGRGFSDSRLVFTGEISDDTDNVNRRLTVVSGGVERRLVVPDDTPITHGRDNLSVHKLKEGDVVRVSAVRQDADLWRALRVDVISSIDVRKERAERVETTDRFGSADVDYRSETRVNLTGEITDDTDNTNRYITVTTNGVERRFVVPESADIFHSRNPLSVHELKEGDIVRVIGVREESDLWRALRVDVISAVDVRKDRAERVREGGRYGASSTGTETRITLTGEVTDDTDNTNRYITVSTNGVERRFVVPETSEVIHNRDPLSVHELKEGDIVRVVGVQEERDLWRALRVDVISAIDVRKDRAERVRESDRFGGSELLAEGRSVFTGRLTDDTDNTNRRLSLLSQGVERRFVVPDDAVIFFNREPMSVHELKEGDEVRVYAMQQRDDLWRVYRIDVVRPAEARLGGSDRITEDLNVLRTYSGVGVVQKVNKDDRSVVLRVGDKTRTVYAAESRFNRFRNEQELRKGDRVSIRGTMEGEDVFASEMTLLD